MSSRYKTTPGAVLEGPLVHPIISWIGVLHSGTTYLKKSSRNHKSAPRSPDLVQTECFLNFLFFLSAELYLIPLAATLSVLSSAPRITTSCTRGNRPSKSANDNSMWSGSS